MNKQRKEWAIAIHGGAGNISKNMPDSVVKAYRDDLTQALPIGRNILNKGGSALDAVENIIKYLEDDPRFNAGKGSVFNHQGEHELDAAIMIGNTGKAGAVAGVRAVKNPISLARLVMEKTDNVMLAGPGATDMNVERVNQQYFYTEKQYEAWKKALQKNPQSLNLNKPGAQETQYGTVGCLLLIKTVRL